MEKLTATVVASGIGGAVIGFLRAVVARYGSVWQYVSAAVGGLLAAPLAALALHDRVHAGLYEFLIGAAALTGEFLVLGLVIMGQQFAANPKESIVQLWEAMRGRHPK